MGMQAYTAACPRKEIKLSYCSVASSYNVATYILAEPCAPLTSIHLWPLVGARDRHAQRGCLLTPVPTQLCHSLTSYPQRLSAKGYESARCISIRRGPWNESSDSQQVEQNQVRPTYVTFTQHRSLTAVPNTAS